MGDMAAQRLRVSPPARAAFQDRLRALMDERGLSIAETARRASEHLPDGEELSRAALRHYLRGRSLPRMRSLDALALGLGVEKSELIGHFGDADHVRGTVRVEDFGGEAHLWVKQRVPWPLALEILRLLGVEGHPELASAQHTTHSAQRRTGLETIWGRSLDRP